MYRSTKGASKARRDQINAEIRNLKELLPVDDDDKARLSYLHIMSLACMYTRKSVFFSQELPVAAGGQEEGGGLLSLPELSELMHTLPGFLLVLSSEGKLLYLSDNVAEHLGHSMVDLVAQSDSVYDIIEPNDHFIMRSNLQPTTSPEKDRLFRCRFNTSKFVRRQGAGTRLTLVRARCLSPPCPASSYWAANPVWVCSCSPLEPQAPYPATTRNPILTPPPDNSFFLASFQSRHARDMRLQEAQDSMQVYLGYDLDALRSRSWYSILHPRDLAHASAQHSNLLGGERQVEMVVQVEASDQSWVWLYMVLQLENGGEHPISSLNYVISESEAWSVRQQLSSEQTQLALYVGAGGPYPDVLGTASSDFLPSPDQVFTPSSSGLSAQSFDFSVATSSRSSSEEFGGAPAAGHSLLLTLGSDSQQQGTPNTVEEGVFTQQQQRWQRGAKFPSTSQMTVAQSDLKAPPMPTPLQRPATMPTPSQRGELVCTPPYTPQFGGGRFIFADEQYILSCTSAGVTSQMALRLPSSAKEPQGLTNDAPGLIVPRELQRTPRYEKLPPLKGMNNSGDCSTTALPEITGPLYVDVPHEPFSGALEGLLTPEASPTKGAFPTLFSQVGREKQIERLEISLLAEYLSTLAEGFCHNTGPSLSSAASSSASCSLSHNQAPWDGADLSTVPEDVSLFEESVLVEPPSPFPPHVTTCSSTSSSSLPSPQCSPNTPVSWCPPFICQGGETATGVCQFSSVQTTQYNRAAEGSIPGSELPGDGEAHTQGAMEVTTSSVIAALPELEPPATAPGLSCAQSLLEELDAMEPMFGASAPLAPTVGQHPELYQLPHQNSPRRFYQDGTSDHTF
ncbi:neuronal PAS domain-containing protein 4B [Denticeps clupeoides]|uniref:neuronal PAS domain-containing protein 4B n=1 Tax=Denticeps clupeoides TaxID=299321 RepID=UPI0010A516BF|nr:neuronal PAS domain-containing protein 4B-like [Denticeps clupeoides]